MWCSQVIVQTSAYTGFRNHVLLRNPVTTDIAALRFNKSVIFPFLALVDLYQNLVRRAIYMVLSFFRE